MRRCYTSPVSPTSTPAHLIVLDTQVVMDWLVFDEPSMHPLVHAIEAEALRWIGLPAMQAELLHVLGRGIAARYSPDLAHIQATFSRLCHVQDVPPPAIHLRCRDTDDQMFIDLAIAARARWLVSRDRAVLALAKRARSAGLDILSPQNWVRQHQAATLSVSTDGPPVLE